MDIVSFEVSQLLYQAGFPQPAPAFGTKWYDSSSRLWIITSPESDSFPQMHALDGWDFFTNKKDLIYALTVSDLISALGDRYRIESSHGDRGWVFLVISKEEIVRQKDVLPCWHDTLIDALAHKWLLLKASGLLNA